MLTLLHPWGLLALGGIPVVIGLYFFRQRFQPRRIAGLFLWPIAAQEPPSGRKRRRIDTPLTLFIELLAVLLLAALVSGLRWETSRSLPHLVVILDHSASMAARTPSGERASDRAVRAVEEMCTSLGDPSSVLLTVILSGPHPHVLVGPAARASDRLRALKTWTPALPRHSLAPAMTLATRLSDAGGQITVITDDPDHVAAELGSGVHIRAVGSPQPNIAITLAERVPSASGSHVFVRIANFGPEPTKRTVTLSDEKNATLATTSIELAPGTDTPLSWDLSPETGMVRVSIAEQDALDWDNTVLLVRPRPLTIRIRCDHPADVPLTSRIERACTAVSNVAWLKASDPEIPHIIVRPTAEEPLPAPSWGFTIGPPPTPLRAGEPAAPLIGPYVADASHPLMEQLDFRGVIWSGAYPIKSESGVLPLLSAGDLPLLFEWKTGRTQEFQMNIDASRSNCHKSPAWPLLFHNLVRLRREHLPGLKRWNYRAGDTVTYRLEHPDERTSAHTSDKSEIAPVSTNDFAQFVDLWRPGLYKITSSLGPESSEEFAINLIDPSESDLRALRDVAPASVEPSGPMMVLQTTYWRWLDWLLTALLVALVLFDFILIARRHPKPSAVPA